MSSLTQKKILFNFFLALSALFVLLLTLILLALLDQKIVERRAGEFCASLSIGQPFDPTELRRRIGQTANTRIVSLSDSHALIQFRAHLPHYYTCSFSVRDGKVVGRKVEYKD